MVGYMSQDIQQLLSPYSAPTIQAWFHLGIGSLINWCGCVSWVYKKYMQFPRESTSLAKDAREKKSLQNKQSSPLPKEQIQ